MAILRLLGIVLGSQRMPNRVQSGMTTLALASFGIIALIIGFFVYAANLPESALSPPPIQESWAEIAQERASGFFMEEADPQANARTLCNDIEYVIDAYVAANDAKKIEDYKQRQSEYCAKADKGFEGGR